MTSPAVDVIYAIYTGSEPGPHFVCWILGVVPFNMWLISCWEEHKCCYKLSKCTKWHLFHSKWLKLSFCHVLNGTTSEIQHRKWGPMITLTSIETFCKAEWCHVLFRNKELQILQIYLFAYILTNFYSHCLKLIMIEEK